ncbi:hypothetical protein [Bacillus sp. SIMBA_005]|jgi:hypothetical protein
MTTNSKPTASRKPWQKPALRAVLPAQRTRGGPVGPSNQDDAWYSLS